jgi:hypothetical protein
MKTLITVMVLGFFLLAAGIGGLIWQQEMQNRNLQAALGAAQDRLERLESGQTEMTQKLHAARQRADKYEAELTRQREESASKSSEPPEIRVPQPQPVKTYLGGQYIGQGWMIPSNLSTNSDTGQISYEPVLRLDERLHGRLRESQTAQSPREVNYYYNISRSHAAAAAAAFVPSFGRGTDHGKGRRFQGGQPTPPQPGTVQTPFRRNSADDVRRRMQTPSTRPSSYISNVHRGSSFINPRGNVRPQGLATPATQIQTRQPGLLRR